jgi:hypothetical protein
VPGRMAADDYDARCRHACPRRRAIPLARDSRSRRETVRGLARRSCPASRSWQELIFMTVGVLEIA